MSSHDDDETPDERDTAAGEYVDSTYKFLRGGEELLNFYGFQLEDFTFLEKFVSEGDEFSLYRVYRLALENGEALGIDDNDKGRLFTIGAILGYALGLQDLKDD